MKNQTSTAVISARMHFPAHTEALYQTIMKQPAVYILASARNGTLYVGVTSDLQKRVWQHRSEQADGFTKKYGVHRLVYFELHADMPTAITREKQIKKWNRAWKLALIEKENPEWTDLWQQII